jgi:hypothetical protein
MKRLVLALLLAAATSVAVQNRSAELGKAYPEARNAYNSLRQAIARRDQGIESPPGERTGSVAGASRPNEYCFARQAILEQVAAAVRKRYEAAMKRRNDLK